MLVDVTFDGVPLARGATARPDGNGWFVELELPMPVGTLLQVSGEAQATVRVERVVEGVGAGMLLRPTAVEKAAPEKAPEPKKPDKAEAKSDEGEDEPEPAVEPAIEKEKGSNGAGKDRRKKNRKS